MEGFKSRSATESSCGVSDTDVDPFPQMRSCLGPEQVFPIVSSKSTLSSIPSSCNVFKNAGRPARPGLSPTITRQFCRNASTALWAMAIPVFGSYYSKDNEKRVIREKKRLIPSFCNTSKTYHNISSNHNIEVLDIAFRFKWQWLLRVSIRCDSGQSLFSEMQALSSILSAAYRVNSRASGS